MARLGLEDRGEARPEVLSGGEVQRVGIARALAHEPRLILADEPTVTLDEDNSARIVELLVNMSKELGATAVMVTHDPLVASKADCVLRLNGGRLIPDDKSGRTISTQP